MPLVAVLLAALVVGGCDEEAPTEPDAQIPNIISEDLDGERFLLSETEGEVVMLSFFQPSCGGCQAEAPVLRSLHERFAGDGLVIVAVDAGLSTEEELRAFKERFELPYRIVYDDQRIITQGYRVQETPTTYVISRDAELLGPYVGAQREATWTELLQPLLAEGGR